MPLTASSLVCLAASAIASLPEVPVEAPRPTAGVLLQYRFSAGETIRYRVEHKATFIASASDVRDKQATESRTDRCFKVTSVADDGTMTLRFSLDRARMQLTFDDGTPIRFDSESSEPVVRQFEGVKQAIGRQLAEVRLAPDGTVENLRPLLSDEELAAIPGKLGLTNAGAGNGDADPESKLFVVFPDRPLKVGERWNDTFPVRVSVTDKLTQEVKILRQYQLESVENGIATIAVKTSPLTILTEPSLLVQIIQRTSSGTIRFDLDAGRVIGRTVEFDNMELGWAGADSVYRAVSTWSERLAGEPAAISAR